jgi:hypothetical protein
MDFPAEEDYIYGDIMFGKILKAVSKNNWSCDDIVAIIKPWVNFLCEHATSAIDKGNDSSLDNLFVPKNFIDCIPVNIIFDKKDSMIKYFDCEWIAKGNLPMGYIIFRGLLVCFQKIKCFAPPSAETPIHYLGIIGKIMSVLGFDSRDVSIQRWLDKEGVLYTKLVGSTGHIDNYNEFLKHEINIFQLSKLCHEHNTLTNSYSYRIGRLITSPVRLMRKIKNYCRIQKNSGNFDTI